MQKKKFLNVVLASSLVLSLSGMPTLVHAVDNQPFFEYVDSSYAEGVVDIDEVATYYTKADAQHLRELAQLSMQYKKIYDAYAATLPSYESFIQWMSSMLKPDTQNATLTNELIERVVGMKKAEASGKLKTQFNEIKGELTGKLDEAPAENRARVQATIDKLDALANGGEVDPGNAEVAGTLEAAKQLIADPSAKPPVPGFVETSPEEEADMYRKTYAKVLAKTPETVVADDEAAVDDALVALTSLKPEVQALLKAERTKLEDLQVALAEKKALAEEIDGFKADFGALLTKTDDTIEAADLDELTRALDKLTQLSPAAQKELAAEKKTLQDLFNTLQIQDQAQGFRDAYADILNKQNADITLDDEQRIADGLAEIAGYEQRVQDLLAPEESTLEGFKKRIDELKADRAAADAFKDQYAPVLDEATLPLANADELDTINAALDDFNAGTPGFQQLLQAEKQHLDLRKLRAEANKQTVDAYLDAHEAVLTKQPLTAQDLDAVAAALADYEQLDEASKLVLKPVYEYLLAQKQALSATAATASAATNAPVSKKKLPKTGEAAVAGVTALGGLLSVLAARGIKRSKD